MANQNVINLLDAGVEANILGLTDAPAIDPMGLVNINRGSGKDYVQSNVNMYGNTLPDYLRQQAPMKGSEAYAPIGQTSTFKGLLGPLQAQRELLDKLYASGIMAASEDYSSPVDVGQIKGHRMSSDTFGNQGGLKALLPSTPLEQAGYFVNQLGNISNPQPDDYTDDQWNLMQESKAANRRKLLDTGIPEATGNMYDQSRGFLSRINPFARENWSDVNLYPEEPWQEQNYNLDSWGIDRVPIEQRLQETGDSLKSFITLPDLSGVNLPVEEPTGSLFGNPSVRNANTLMLNSLMPISTGDPYTESGKVVIDEGVQTDYTPKLEPLVNIESLLADDHIDRTPVYYPTADAYLDALNTSFNPNLANIIYDSGISGNLTPVQEAFDNYVEQNVLGVDIPKTTDWRSILGIDPNPGYTAKEILGIRESNPRVLNQRTPARRYNRDEFGNVRSLARFIEPEVDTDDFIINNLIEAISPVVTSQQGSQSEQDYSSNEEQASEADEEEQDQQEEEQEDEEEEEEKTKTKPPKDTKKPPKDTKKPKDDGKKHVVKPATVSQVIKTWQEEEEKAANKVTTIKQQQKDHRKEINKAKASGDITAEASGKFKAKTLHNELKAAEASKKALGQNSMANFLQVMQAQSTANRKHEEAMKLIAGVR